MNFNVFRNLSVFFILILAASFYGHEYLVSSIDKFLNFKISKLFSIIYYQLDKKIFFFNSMSKKKHLLVEFFYNNNLKIMQ